MIYGLIAEFRDEAALVDRHVFGLTLEPEPERVYPQVGGGPGSTLAAVAHVLKIPEFGEARDLIMRRLRRTAN